MSAADISTVTSGGGGASALDIPISWTGFRDHTAQTKAEREGSLRSLVPMLRDTRAPTKAALPWLKLATFGDARTPKGSLRHDANIREIHGIEADYDGETITLERARHVLMRAGIAAILYTSPSHTAERPRWRILCPCSAPLAASARERLVARINGLFVGALAGESFTASQAYYYGALSSSADHKVIAVDGRPIDLAHDLDPEAVGKPERPKAQASVSGPAPKPRNITNDDGTPYGLAGLSRECAAIRSAHKGHKWETINRSAYSIGGLVAAGELLEGAAYSALRDAVYALRGDCEDFDHALETLRIGFDDGKAAPRSPPPPRLLRRVTEEFVAPEPPPRDAAPDHWRMQAEDAPPRDFLRLVGGPEPAPPPPPAGPLWTETSTWNPSEIPKRPWLVPGHLMRGAVSVLSGQGAGGKSSLVVAWSIALAAGTSIGGFSAPAPCHVVNYNVEDDRYEQQRRYTAALQAAEQDAATVMPRITRCGPHDVGTLFERNPDTGRIVPTSAMDALERLCMETEADCLVCDPLAELHNAEENDNTAMRAVIAAFRGMAKRLGISVLLLHHDRKGNSAPGDMDRMRGASAISGAVRVALTLTTMTAEEADKLGVAPDERRRHFRIDGAKSNYAPTTEAEWWRISAYEIPNGEHIAACLPWEPPTAFGGLPASDCVKALHRIHKGTQAGHAFAATKQAGPDWAGNVLVEMFSKTPGQATAILGAWVQSGVLVLGEHEGPRRGHPRRAFTVNMAAVSEMARSQRGGNDDD